MMIGTTWRNGLRRSGIGAMVLGLAYSGCSSSDTSGSGGTGGATATDTPTPFANPRVCADDCPVVTNFGGSKTKTVGLKAKGAQKTITVDGKDTTLNVSMFNESLPGPTVEINTTASDPQNPKSGDLLILDVTNEGGLNVCCWQPCLDPKDPESCWAPYCKGSGLEMGDPCKQVDGDTNIHTHGLHIGGATAEHAAADACQFTTTDPKKPDLPWDNILISIPAAGMSDQMSCTAGETCSIPNHQSFFMPLPPQSVTNVFQPDPVTTPHWFGLEWYHPHMHETSQDQVGRGLAGALVIRNPAEKTIPALAGLGADSERILVLQSLPSDDGSPQPGTVRLVNGLSKPEMTIKAGETQRWRVLDATSDSAVQISVVNPKDQDHPIEFFPIGFDGVPTPDIRPALKSWWLVPGSRLEVLLTAPSDAKEGDTYDVTWCEPALDPFKNVKDDMVPDSKCTGTSVTMATLKVVAGAATPTSFAAGDAFADLASFGLVPDLWAGTADVSRTIKFVQGFTPEAGATFMLDLGDGKGPQEFSMDQACDAPIQGMLGTVEEWTIENWTTEFHTFHLHVNPFQVDPSTLDSKLGTTPFYQDDIVLPPGKSSNNPANPNEASEPGVRKMRVKYKDYPGTSVFHCHLLFHEDHGMMAAVTVAPSN